MFGESKAVNPLMFLLELIYDFYCVIRVEIWLMFFLGRIKLNELFFTHSASDGHLIFSLS